jgi:hypothetical protein
MTRAKPTSRNSEFNTQVLEGELFRLASIELFGCAVIFTTLSNKRLLDFQRAIL